MLEEHKDELDELNPGGYFFQHDKLKVHHSAEDWMKRQKFKLVNFPTYSPDLSPIESLWGTLKETVGRDNPKTEEKLRKSLIKNWKNITQVNNLRPYFDNLRGRYKECIQKMV